VLKLTSHFYFFVKDHVTERYPTTVCTLCRYAKDGRPIEMRVLRHMFLTRPIINQGNRYDKVFHYIRLQCTATPYSIVTAFYRVSYDSPWNFNDATCVIPCGQ